MNTMYWLKNLCPYNAIKQSSEISVKTKQECSKLIHDYIKCLHDDETCCADIYQKYMKCYSTDSTIQTNDNKS